MSFNFANFMSAMSAMLPAVGEAVIALHPANAPEALKIQIGTQLIQVIAASLHQSTKTADVAPATAAPAAPAPAPAPVAVQTVVAAVPAVAVPVAATATPAAA